MKVSLLVFFCSLLASTSYASVKYALMMSPESSAEMPYQKANSYCQNLHSACERSISGSCGEQEYSSWSLPAKEELDRFAGHSRAKHYVWTKSRLFATGDIYPAVYRLSNGGSYAPSFGKEYRVRCVKWTTI